MLIKIIDTLWIDLDEIYLIERDEYTLDRIYVYIRMHPKYPITLDGQELHQLFLAKMEEYQLYKKRNCFNEESTSTTQDVTQTSEVTLE